MKKVFFTLLFVALSYMTFAQQWNSISGNRPAAPQVKLVSSDDNQIVVDFSLSGFNLSRVSTPNGTQQIVSVPKMVSMLEKGAPDLPHFAISAIIGDVAEMSVSVTKSAFIDYEGIEIAPSKGNFSRQIDPETVPYTYGEMYTQNTFYPATQARLDAPYIIRDLRGQNIMVMPFAYNPVSKTLRVYTNLTLTMTKVSDNGENQKAARKSASTKVDPQMLSYYNRRFVNFGESAAKYNFIEDFGEMIVICPEQYMEAMQPFVDWKNMSGRPTTLVSLTEAGGNNDSNIKKYIEDTYHDPERNLAYILLVGDYSDITPHTMGDGRSDNWFGQLEGDDYYLEAFTGRFSVQSVQDVETHVNKVLYYERDMPAGLTWLNTAIGIGANEGAGNGHNGGEADYVHMNYIRDTLLHYTYSTVTQQYSGVGSGTSIAALSADFNAGKSWCNYCNHGSQTSWGVTGFSNSNVNALVNDYMWPYIISVACNNGQFDGTCFGEAWLRATNNSTGAPTGAIGGMFSWISQPWTPPMTGQDEMVDIITEWYHTDQFNHTMGGAFLNGNMKILDAHQDSDGTRTYNTWILFGDPSLMLRTDNPTELDVTCTPSSLLIGMSELDITLDADYAIATLVMDDEILASSRIIDGHGTLNFDALTNVGDATLTIVAYNKVTYTETIKVEPSDGAFLIVKQYNPNNAHVGDETGLNMTFENVGNAATSGATTITLSCDDQNLTIINGTTTIDVVEGNATVDVNDVFSYSIAQGVADGTKFIINVTMTCGSETWAGKASITAGEAILDFAGFTWPGSYEPGETLAAMVTFKNKGHYKATNGVVSIASTSQYISFAEESVEVGTIEASGNAYAVFHITINAGCPTTEQIPLNFTITADGGLTAEGSGTLKNTCNVVFELSDSYGDGWNGASINVAYSDGTPSQSLTIDSGNSASYTLEIGTGVHVTLTWNSGSWDAECSFSVAYEDGTTIYQSSGTPTAGLIHEFDCNCGSASGGDSLDPVSNLTAVQVGNVITLTWDAPANAISYDIRRNGILMPDAITETTFEDEITAGGIYTYCVFANYADGQSLPECVQVISDWSVIKSEAQFSIYPNPTNGMLNINGSEAGYSYVIYNGMGQEVLNGTAQGSHQVNLSSLTKGLYFIRLTSGMQTNIQKVVVE